MSRHASCVIGFASLGLLLACTSKEAPQRTGEPAAAPPRSAASVVVPPLPATEPTASSPANARGSTITLADVDKLRDEIPPPHARAHSEGDPLPQLVFRQLTGGADIFCGAHTSGTIRCWGATFWQRLLGAYTQVAAGDAFVCALDRAGAITCAPGDKVPRYTPPVPASVSATAAASAPPAASVSASSAPPGSSAAPPPPYPVGKFKTIVAAGTRACVLDDGGKITCWGETAGCAAGAPPEQGGFRKVALGDCHACALDAKGAVTCWGTPERPSLAVPEGLVAREIAAGRGFACAVDAKNALACWGKPPSLPDDLPTELEKIGARDEHVCVLAKGGALRCWGATGTSEAGPFQSVAVANRGVCGHLDKDKIACFGQATQGQLDVPLDDTKPVALDGGGTKEERAEKRKRRAALFEELWAKLPEKELPFAFDRQARLPAGGVLDEKFLPVVLGLQLHETFSRSTFHEGFRFKTEGPFRVIALYEQGNLELRTFDENGVRLGVQLVASSRIEAGSGWRFNDNRALEERFVESTLGADLEGKSTRHRTFEIHDQTTTEGNKHFCRVKRATTTFAIDGQGRFSEKVGDFKQISEKYGPEGCSAAWLGGDASKRKATFSLGADSGGGGW